VEKLLFRHVEKTLLNGFMDEEMFVEHPIGYELTFKKHDL